MLGKAGLMVEGIARGWKAAAYTSQHISSIGGAVVWGKQAEGRLGRGWVKAKGRGRRGGGGRGASEARQAQGKEGCGRSAMWVVG